jgi:death on curing protein
MARFLTTEEVIALNYLLIERYSPGEMVGVKFPDLLESAVYRPQQSVFGEEAYPNIFMKAAALFESLAQNHAFHAANKRTAFAALVQYLAYNGYLLNMSPKAAEDFTFGVVEHKFTLEEVCVILRDNSK